MKLTDSELRDLHRSATAAGARQDCPSADLLVRAALGELAPADRDRIVDHLVRCADCADEYRAAAPVRHEVVHSEAAPSLPRASRLPLAAAAAIALLALTGAVWSAIQLRATRAELVTMTAQLETQRQEADALRRLNDALEAPQLNVPIVDLGPRDALRGGPEPDAREFRVVIAADAPAITLILTATVPTADPEYALEIVDARGVAVWSGRGLRPSRDGSLTMTLGSGWLPAGSYRFHLKRLPALGGATIEQYAVRIEYS